MLLDRRTVSSGCFIFDCVNADVVTVENVGRVSTFQLSVNGFEGSPHRGSAGLHANQATSAYPAAKGNCLIDLARERGDSMRLCLIEKRILSLLKLESSL